MSIGFWQIAVVVILVVLLFGRGKISSLMGATHMEKSSTGKREEANDENIEVETCSVLEPDCEACQ